jgi:hypothetical protein
MIPYFTSSLDLQTWAGDLSKLLSTAKRAVLKELVQVNASAFTVPLEGLHLPALEWTEHEHYHLSAKTTAAVKIPW